ncbi:Gfo/Idh/MocA family oxidoreductase [Thalassoglobus sp. JC818]|uniref:Gfo/Idh/MocA family oxidoreductase n=1 Tax=Thalassoglobus sp. JC818 TaxID=3232136 RepID=UPI0034597BA8
MPQTSRRDFLKTTSLAAAGTTLPLWFSTNTATAQSSNSPNERLTVGCIGTGSRWNAVGPASFNFADCLAVADVDANHAEAGKKKVQDIHKKNGRPTQVDVYEDYQKILERDDIDIVTIVTPDHWHSKIAIEALQAGKDVYCEKPLTLTIHEGKQIIKVLEETNRVFQVGTQQRTEMGQRFLTAIAMIRDGRIGDVKKVTCNIGGSSDSGPIPVADVPQGLNWEKWLGQAPVVDFRFKEDGRWGKSRCHYEFRWWYEYSGGKMTDWGAHHVDIAQWAIDQNGPGQGPVSVEPIMSVHPVPFKDGMPQMDDRYNAATDFDVKVVFKNGVEMHIVNNSPDGNGILFEGTKGRFHVSRSRIKGKPFEDLQENPLPEDAIAQVYGGKQPTSHMQNFFDCVQSREKPISDVWTHHSAMTTCHLANIAIRLDKTLEWDTESQNVTNDSTAQQMQQREQRKGYEINVSV